MRAQRLVIWALALGFLVWLPTGASAQNRTLSGKHKMFCCNQTPALPIFAQPAYGAPPGYWTSFYTGLGFPTSLVVHTPGSNSVTLHPATSQAKGLVKIGPANVTATGAGYKTLILKQGQISATASNYNATPGTPRFSNGGYLHTTLYWKNAAGTLKPGGSWPVGPVFAAASTWSFCPPNHGPGVGGSGCTAARKAGVPFTHTAGSSTFPTQTTIVHLPGSTTGTDTVRTTNRNGRLVRKKGANKFGGVMNLLGGNTTVLKFHPSGATYLPVYLFGTNSIINTPIGGAAGTVAGVPYISGGTVAKWALSLSNLTLIHTTASNSVPTTVTVPMPAYLEFFGAGPWGTGTLGVTMTKHQHGGLTKISWTLMGYDNRTPTMGYGNLQLVSGVMYNGLNVQGSVTLGNRLTLTLPEPGPAVAISAGALALAGLGWIRVRRRR